MDELKQDREAKRAETWMDVIIRRERSEEREEAQKEAAIKMEEAQKIIREL